MGHSPHPPGAGVRQLEDLLPATCGPSAIAADRLSFGLHGLPERGEFHAPKRRLGWRGREAHRTSRWNESDQLEAETRGTPPGGLSISQAATFSGLKKGKIQQEWQG